MKAFIIYTNHEQSIDYATQCLRSFAEFKGWEPVMFEGLTPSCLPTFEHLVTISHASNSRAADYYTQDINKYTIKKCCSLNHYRLFKKCVELNEPIAVVEHDSHCIGDWTDVTFDGVLVLNVLSAMEQSVLENIRHRFETPDIGVNDIRLKGLHYRHDDNLRGSHIMPGTAAYAITPAAALRLIDVYETQGWEQSDFIINTGYVRIQTIVPELFTFKLPNLATSHGKNMENVL